MGRPLQSQNFELLWKLERKNVLRHCNSLRKRKTTNPNKKIQNQPPKRVLGSSQLIHRKRIRSDDSPFSFPVRNS
jgi:hypothetical protein